MLRDGRVCRWFSPPLLSSVKTSRRPTVPTPFTLVNGSTSFGSELSEIVCHELIPFWLETDGDGSSARSVDARVAFRIDANWHRFAPAEKLSRMLRLGKR